MEFGFTLEKWEILAAALQLHVVECEIKKTEDTPFGKRFVLEGILQTPDDRKPQVRTVWFIDTGQEIPRFVTAYPLKEGDDD